MPDPWFSDDEIRQRAYEIYQARGSTPGDPNTDWREAIRQLEQERSTLKGKRFVFFRLKHWFVQIEKEAIEPTANRLDKADIFRIFERISPVIEAIGVFAGAIIIPVVIWQLSERAQEAKERQEKAIRAQTAVQNYLNQLSDTLITGKLKSDEDLQTIVRASTLALLDNPDLQPDPNLKEEENRRNDRKGQVIGYLLEAGLIQVEVPEQSQNSKQVGEPQKPVISLSRSNLSSANLLDADLIFTNLRGANLRGANLGIADLRGADLFGADLFGADLIGANLIGANLIGANFNNANFNGANLSSADLRVANLNGVDLRGTDLNYANLNGADVVGADLHNADLIGANFNSANLNSANFNGADLNSADFNGANLSSADLRDAENWVEEELAQAKLCKTRLPLGTSLDPDRNCKELGIPTN
jgi:uncharacterized protein YjbI with pentapeptide repeats